MPAPKGNQYWKLAHNFRKPKKFTPKKLLEKALEYMKWCENNPLHETRVFGTGLTMIVPKMRAMTIQGFCFYANMEPTTFYDYENNEAYYHIVTRIKQMFFSQKFEGAAAELLNPNIIARELGLAEKSEHSIKSEQPLFPDVSKNASNQ